MAIEIPTTIAHHSNGHANINNDNGNVNYGNNNNGNNNNGVHHCTDISEINTAAPTTAPTTATTATAASSTSSVATVISDTDNNNTSSSYPHSHPRIINIINTNKYDRYLPIIGLFVFYIAHDALQERMFHFPGFEFGFFMTLIEVLVMLLGSVILNEDEANAITGIICTSFQTRKRNRTRKPRTLSPQVLLRIGIVGLFLAFAHGLGNTSLNYSPYPLKVAFKSCKLVPTMALGACVTGRKHSVLQYAAAFIMGMGLAVLTAADVFHHSKHQTLSLLSASSSSSSSSSLHGGVVVEEDSVWRRELGPFIGPILLTVSTVFDSIVPNLQEQLLQGSAKVKTSEMILVSNMVMCVVLVTYTLYSGELLLAYSYCIRNKDAAGILVVQGLCAYLGLKCYLGIIRDYGGVVGVLVANARKVVTIVLSFLLFADNTKSFNERHFVGLCLVFAGVYLGYLSKRGGDTESSEDGRTGSSSTSSSADRKRRKRRKRRNDKSHHHNV